MLHQNLVLGGLGDDHEGAVAQGRNRGQRRPGQPRPVGAVGPCLESESLGAPENLRCADFVGCQPMPDTFAVGGDTLEVQQSHEGIESRVLAVASVSVLICILQG